MRTQFRHPLVILILVSFLVAGCTVLGGTDPSGSTSRSEADQYCNESGGVVETRYPFYGTNNANPLQLAGSMQVCTFTSPDDGSKILIATDTLYADQPSLAVQAYLNPPRLEPGQPSVNPSSLYCSQLGGTDLFGGVNASGGAWALEGAADAISMCVFPDLSSIDSWGLTYHSEGTVRGADLTDLFRYQPEE